jgi:hypothetical protein
LLVALENCPREDIIPIFCDTGNEHQAVHDYLVYVEQALDIEIVRLKADFAEQIYAKRIFIARDQRRGRKHRKVPKTDRNGNPVYEKNKDGSVCMYPIYADNEDDLGPATRLPPLKTIPNPPPKTISNPPLRTM